MSDAKGTKVITLICERSADLKAHTDESGQLKDAPGVQMVKFPCSGMIQPLMIEAALKSGASGVIVCGCQIGDCYYREGNKMIRERLLGQRPPGLKKTVDRRRVVALWLSRPQSGRFISEAKEFVTLVNQLNEEASAIPEVEKHQAASKQASTGKPSASEAIKEGSLQSSTSSTKDKVEDKTAQEPKTAKDTQKKDNGKAPEMKSDS